MRRAALAIATANRGKLAELRALLEDLPLDVRGLEAGSVALPEEGDEYEANARAKAEAVARALGAAALGDDSGLEVDALGGDPGPHSARYGGPRLDDAGRVAHLLDVLAAHGEASRTARFVCHAALAIPGGETVVARGVCEGRIAPAPRGAGGFGYDPVFLVDDPTVPAGLTMAELPPEQKNRLSHRARAVAALRPALEALASGAQESAKAAKRS